MKYHKRTAALVFVNDITKRKLTEVDLQKSETKLRSIFESVSNIAVQGYDKNRRVIFWNKASEKLYGYSNIEAMHRKLEDLIIPEDAKDFVVRSIDRWLNYDIPIPAGELLLKKKNNDLIQVYSSHVMQENANGDKEMFCIDIDLTKLKETEKELEIKEENLRTVADFAYDWEYWLDENGNYIYNSPSCKRITGFDSHLFVENKSKLMEIVHPLDKEFLKFHLDNECNSETVHEMLFRIIDKKGDVKWLEHVCQPVYSKNNEFLGRRGCNRDVTSRILTQQNLRKNEARFRAITEKGSDLIIITNKDHYITYASPSVSFFGFSQNYLLDKKPSLFVHKDYIPKLRKTVLKVESQPGKSFLLSDIRVVKKDGTNAWLEGMMTCLYEQPGINGIVFNGRDITERRKAEQQIKKSLIEKEILLKEIHHRVKNNLQIITSLLNLQAQSIKDEKVKTIFLESKNRVKTMGILHKKLYMSEDISTINFKDYVKSISIDLLRSFGVIGKIQVIFNITHINLNIDIAIPCGLIINELISNSIKYAFSETSQEKIISISLNETIDKKLCLKVSDNGIGFDLTNESRIDQTALGTQIVKLLVQQIKGQLKSIVCGGTNIEITFPKE